jgi:hypothetical protein
MHTLNKRGMVPTDATCQISNVCDMRSDKMFSFFLSVKNETLGPFLTERS